MAPRTGRPHRRIATGFAPRRISVFTEGSKTEPGYIKHWHRLYRDRVQVIVFGGLGAPMQVVESAVETKKREAREARRGRGSASNEYWCVIDVDRHPHVGRAVEKAQANGVAIAVSNPCMPHMFHILGTAPVRYSIGHRDKIRRIRRFQRRRTQLISKLPVATFRYLSTAGQARRVVYADPSTSIDDQASVDSDSRQPCCHPRPATVHRFRLIHDSRFSIHMRVTQDPQPHPIFAFGVLAYRLADCVDGSAVGGDRSPPGVVPGRWSTRCSS